MIDANSGFVVSHWDNIQHLEEAGPGGNEKVQQYWYGKEDLPSLVVKNQEKECWMDGPKVRLVNLKFAWDWNGSQLKAHQYLCGKSHEDQINGAFSPINDAYYLGHVIVDMYKDWYGMHALQDRQGNAKPLIMRVHFGRQFDNAFWDGTSMTFGDGKYFYPLVALDVAGHEVTHGFTEQHAALEYHDQSGSLNESMSDMAGQSARAYLLKKSPLLYNKMHVEKNEVTWGIGESIIRSANKALRYMHKPSSDGASADCFYKTVAKKFGMNCAINYAQVVANAKKSSSIPSRQQSYIVHMASGVFNKAFYLFAQEIGIRKAYELMLLANIKYWTPTTDFNKGACGVMYAAKDLALDKKLATVVFGKVGIDVSVCKG